MRCPANLYLCGVPCGCNGENQSHRAVSDLLDYPAAAALAGVRETTVRQWKSRHLLTPAGTDERGRLLFRAADVLAADQHTRATPGGRKRTTGGNR